MKMTYTIVLGAISVSAVAACTIGTTPALQPTPVVVQTPAPTPSTSTVVVPRAY